jgi:putative Mg2+ transporter-C (MgtC) family protein
MHIDNYEIFIRVLAALFCGALLGAEREYRGREAGLKSHSSLAVACCLAILVSAFGFSDAVTQGLIALDPSRIAAGVEGGIGFACAAVIWRSRNKVIGLTTAINIWATANIGMACGAGMFFAAILITGAMFAIHFVLGGIEHRFFPRHNSCTISVSADPSVGDVAQAVSRHVSSVGATLLGLTITQGGATQPIQIEMELARVSAPAYAKLIDGLRALRGVSSVSCSGMCAVD